jgi:hypothetical protein
VPTVAASSSLASVNDLAVYLKRPAFVVGSDEERQAQQAVLIASEAVRSTTGQVFTSGTSTVNLPVPDGQWLALPQRPVTGVTSVTLDGAALVEGVDYTRVGDRLFRYSGWQSYGFGPPVVTVAYSHGGVVPDDVLGAVLAVAADLFDNPLGLTSETIGNYTWRASESDTGTRAADLLAGVKAAYRRRPLTVPIA